MVETFVKLQEKPSGPSPTAGDQAISGPIAGHGALRPAPATCLPPRMIESRATTAPIQIDDPINVRPGPYDPEKEQFERHSHLSPTLPYDHSGVTYAEHEDDGDDDGPKEHAIWILVGNLDSGEISSH